MIETRQITLDMQDSVAYSRITELTSRLSSLEGKVDSLTIQIAQMDGRSQSFSDILAHQQMLFTSQTAIFIAIVLGLIAIVGLLGWSWFRLQLRRIRIDLNRALETIDQFNQEMESFSGLSSELNQTKNRSLRSLYETSRAQNHRGWTIVWHIRYMEWFLDNDKIDGLSEHCKSLLEEFSSIEKNDIIFLKGLGNKGTVRRTIHRILSLDDKRVESFKSGLVRILDLLNGG